jgi:hypothetical protein
MWSRCKYQCSLIFNTKDQILMSHLIQQSMHCHDNVLAVSSMLNTGVRGQSFALQQTVDIPMGTNWSPLLTDIFLYSCEAYSYRVSQENCKKRSRSFNCTLRYIDDVLSLILNLVILLVASILLSLK